MARRRKNTDKKEPSPKAKVIKPNGEQDIVILFADVVGCSEISNHKKLPEYNEFIRSFQECFTSVCEHYQKQE